MEGSWIDVQGRRPGVGFPYLEFWSSSSVFGQLFSFPSEPLFLISPQPSISVKPYFYLLQQVCLPAVFHITCLFGVLLTVESSSKILWHPLTKCYSSFFDERCLAVLKWDASSWRWLKPCCPALLLQSDASFWLDKTGKLDKCLSCLERGLLGLCSADGFGRYQVMRWVALLLKRPSVAFQKEKAKANLLVFLMDKSWILTSRHD